MQAKGADSGVGIVCLQPEQGKQLLPDTGQVPGDERNLSKFQELGPTACS